mmetsp:Transcript_46657/g.150528  ORF Transcript_46657/g.150528 Transcript_46657/m.150528 type:complete len:209 (+) Transcript_46657:387-1013(+)
MKSTLRWVASHATTAKSVDPSSNKRNASNSLTSCGCLEFGKRQASIPNPVKGGACPSQRGPSTEMHGRDEPLDSHGTHGSRFSHVSIEASATSTLVALGRSSGADAAESGVMILLLSPPLMLPSPMRSDDSRGRLSGLFARLSLQRPGLSPSAAGFTRTSSSAAPISTKKAPLMLLVPLRSVGKPSSLTLESSRRSLFWSTNTSQFVM